MCVVGSKNLRDHMEEIDYNKLYSAIHKYGGAAEFNVKTETHDFYGMGAYTAASMVGRQTITMTMNFHHRDGFDHFAKDLLLLEEIKDEEYVRQRNPTVQQAYEEYQLLLKLSK